jgi:phosphoribosylformimino-5-aminoimidazole carboxamide ribotide isomerase
MQVIPVLDIRGGLVVRGIAGRRHEYRPVVSPLSATARPRDVALAFRQHFGVSEIYLADLDAIGGAPPALAIYGELMALGFRLLVDAGLRDVAGAGPLADGGVHGIVTGLETLDGPDALDRLCWAYGGDRIVFSLDLKDGQPLGNATDWGAQTPRAIAERAIRCGVRRMIVLDLARVGMSSGTGTEELCTQLATGFPDVVVIAGGGIRGVEDLRRFQQAGVQGALVASALHDGRLTRAELESLMT